MALLTNRKVKLGDQRTLLLKATPWKAPVSLSPHKVVVYPNGCENSLLQGGLRPPNIANFISQRWAQLILLHW